MSKVNPTKGLIIKSPWIEKILSGEKTWEIRGSNTKIRGTIALIKSGTGMIYGTVDLVSSKSISLEFFKNWEDKHRIPVSSDTQLPYKKTHVWTMARPKIFKEPIPYKHPQGAVIWVNLGNDRQATGY